MVRLKQFVLAHNGFRGCQEFRLDIRFLSQDSYHIRAAISVKDDSMFNFMF
jgi:hypothetical protein